MIPFEVAIKIVRDNVVLTGTENIDIKKCLNRVLRQNVKSDMDMPPFDKSAMDGFACRMEDIPNELEIIETVPAGYKPTKEIGKNQCAKIMTGAMIPLGADCVIIVEDTEELENGKVKFTKAKTGVNICIKAEDVIKGDQLLSAGIRITPSVIAALALTGCVSPEVSSKPKVGIISTGDEIVEPYKMPLASQIRNTNSYQLLAQLEEFGCDPTYYGIVQDTKEATGEAIKKAKSENDLIILTGGVSMGEFDLVPGLLKENGFDILFDKVAIQPGKPTVFGRDGSKFVFGLPGNPVSSYLIFEIFVKEFLAGVMGLKNTVKLRRCVLANDFKRKHNVRHAWIPVSIDHNNFATPVDYHGSAHITALPNANGIMSVPVGISELKEGVDIDVRQL
ncbi:MAG: molybdopterin molybdotransferase MoeA [Bacteroidetes bacterium]|nr:molybdopterin molybdotransferase MoeA [Bacteroidota bacterium]